MNRFESKYFKTAQKIEDALIFLLEKKPLEYITVKDICQKAKVSRSTFYLHYIDINALLEDVIKRTNDLFISAFKHSKTSYDILNNKDNNNLFLITEEYLIPYLNFIKNNLSIYKAIKNNNDLFKTDKIYEDLFKTLFSPILTRYNVNKSEHRYIMEYYINGICSIVKCWIENDCNEDVYFIYQIINRCIHYEKI